MHSRDDGKSTDAANQPDATATTLTDKHEYQRVFMNNSAVTEGFKATWVNALAERKKQLAQGKL